jgi:hypothetical protein
LLIRASWWAKWVGFFLYDLTLVIGCLLVFLAFVRVAWLVQTWRRRQRADDEVRPPYDVRLSDGRHVVVRDPLAVGLLVFLLPQAFLLWLWAVVRDWRRVIRAAEGGKADRGAAVIGVRVSRSSLRWFGGLVGACVLGWVLVQIPIAPVTFLIPLEPLQVWPPGAWWPWLTYWLVLSVASAPVAAYCQVSVNRLFDRSGSRVWEGPTPSTASLDEPRLGSTADALRDQLNWG